MYVLATAGHVDHGKSTLVRALTGTDPDRLAEERRRGLSIELGFAWTTLPSGDDLAIVDVPGHERFLTTMLAGVGPAPMVMFVAAADDGWMPQAAEHLAVLDALQVRHGVLVVTRADLADPGAAMAAGRRELHGTSLADIPAVAVSARTGAGLDQLRRTIAAVTAALPAPEPAADVRLWVDRCFAVAGAGTVVTGTLPAGRISVGDVLHHGHESLRVRGIQSLGREVEAAHGTARVALRLGRSERSARLGRGSALVTPDAWLLTADVDVALDRTDRLPDHLVTHIGSAATGCRVRQLDPGMARLRLVAPLPLRVADRLVLRDPGSRQVWGASVLDPAPPPLRRRGAARERAAALRLPSGAGSIATELRRRGVVRLTLLRRIGVATEGIERLAVCAGDWALDRDRVPQLREQLMSLVTQRACDRPLDAGVSIAEATRSLGLPDPGLTSALVAPPLRMVGGRIGMPVASGLPQTLDTALTRLELDLTERPFSAPHAARLAELRLDTRSLAAAERAGRLLRLTPSVVLLAGADARASRILAELPQPFTVSDAARALDSSRRVVLPLLALLEARRQVVRLADDTRRCVRVGGSPQAADQP